MTDHPKTKIVSDPVELVPLLVTFNNSGYKVVYEMLSKSWVTEEELCEHHNRECINTCLKMLKKGNLIEEQWRTVPGKKPEKEYRVNYLKFRANFQCSMEDLVSMLYISTSNDESLRDLSDKIMGEVTSGNTSIGEIARKVGVKPIYVKGIAKRLPAFDVRGQGLILLEGDR
ncbi:ArsR family transcriptional regulator [Methanocalculus chunghsingensis]|uniref:ArsR family transcriptional regulator n=1 Tax=Methanocalculus chunghsingensis TaxID=156457 RepID=A0A8J8B4C2_9EURY|nr:ArsR family transcriptional regulator [Methanocalculus chunghsingensis]